MKALPPGIHVRTSERFSSSRAAMSWSANESLGSVLAATTTSASSRLVVVSDAWLPGDTARTTGAFDIVGGVLGRDDDELSSSLEKEDAICRTAGINSGSVDSRPSRMNDAASTNAMRGFLLTSRCVMLVVELLVVVVVRTKGRMIVSFNNNNSKLYRMDIMFAAR